MADFVTVGQADEVAEGEVAAFVLDDRTIAVANVDGALYAFDDVCPHAACSLSEGELEGSVIECPCHGSRFDVTNGEVLAGPATGPVETFTVREQGGDLQVAV